MILATLLMAIFAFSCTSNADKIALLDKSNFETTVDGKETVIYPIEFDKDTDPIIRGEK